MDLTGTSMLTPLELRATEFVAGLAFHASVLELIEQDRDVQIALKESSADDIEISAQIERDDKIINATFMVAGLMLENAKGISA